MANGNRPPMQWLVSVRSEPELLLASQFVVDIIDFKEPLRGPLSPADPGLWESAGQVVAAQHTPMSFTAPLFSAALGEGDEMRRVADRVPANFAFAKVGPSGCSSREQLSELWTEVIQRIPSTVQLVAVAYGDHQAAGCLPPEEIFRLAAERGFQRCLLDTFTKEGQSIFDVFGMERLRGLSVIADELDLWWTLAGSIKLSSLAELAARSVSPHCLGVRGDVCEKLRTSTLSKDRLRLWSETIKQLRPI